MDYNEQLQTEEWAKKRDYILNRDNYTCYLCGYHGLKLNVHHIEYLPNKLAWEYPDEMFFTVCYDCHRKIHMPDLMVKKLENTRVGNIIRNNYGPKTKKANQ